MRFALCRVAFAFGSRSRRNVQAIASAKILAVDEKPGRLTSMRSALGALAEACACGRRRLSCPILDALEDPAESAPPLHASTSSVRARKPRARRNYHVPPGESLRSSPQVARAVMKRFRRSRVRAAMSASSTCARIAAARARAKDHGIHRVPAVVIDGRLADCGPTGAVDLTVLRRLGLGAAQSALRETPSSCSRSASAASRWQRVDCQLKGCGNSRFSNAMHPKSRADAKLEDRPLPASILAAPNYKCRNAL